MSWDSWTREEHVAERRYGRFVRSIARPDTADVKRVEARIERGLLTVRIPKSEPRRARRRIPVGSS